MDITVNAAGLHEVVIDGKTYEFEKWGAEKSLMTFADIAPLVQPSLDRAAAYVAEQKDINVAFFLPDIVRGIATSRKEFMSLVKTLTVGTVCDHKVLEPTDFDKHFANLKHLFNVIRAALEVQYGDFFAASGSTSEIPSRSDQPG